MNSSVFLLLIWTTVLGASITKGPEIVRFTRHHGPWITRGTRRPPSEVRELYQKREAFLFQNIGHFPSSHDPFEVVHFTKVTHPPEVESFKFSFPPKTHRTIGPNESFASKKELVHKLPTFAPGAFTHKWTLPPLGKKTFAPLDLAVTKKPHTHETNGPNKEELSHLVTFPHGAFTQKFTVSPIGKRTFAPVELVGVDEKSLISWAPADFAKVSKKPHITPPPH
ncbi:hypothetical protein GCK72_013784 [Caenorhabditis remanei]|uniref:Uncharacterized protein n=1 Tax=Caenorhabditis remanei TaxID=31234 RepID=A0A6A5GS89_CAERE|nr:hypothetical protein GCK72_013784 [Caenorhabditis remanei]KAF1757329.1 hypothetical protein GCK72_013784 [Caenorhabditis remanei]